METRMVGITDKMHPYTTFRRKLTLLLENIVLWYV